MPVVNCNSSMAVMTLSLAQTVPRTPSSSMTDIAAPVTGSRSGQDSQISCAAECRLSARASSCTRASRTGVAIGCLLPR
jgi:hypothetical protein